MTPQLADMHAAARAIRDAWARHRAAISEEAAARLLGPAPAVMGLDDIDDDVWRELMDARDRSSAVLSAAPTDTTKEN